MYVDLVKIISVIHVTDSRSSTVSQKNFPTLALRSSVKLRVTEINFNKATSQPVSRFKNSVQFSYECVFTFKMTLFTTNRSGAMKSVFPVKGAGLARA